jgi:hypothetical protein
MSQPVDIRAPEVLPRLRMALMRYSEGGETSLRRLQTQIQRTLDYAQGAVRSLEREVARARSRLEDAQHDLYVAQSYQDDDGGRDCSYEEAALYEAQSRLREAQDRFDQGRMHLRRLEEAAQRLRPSGHKFKHLLRTSVPKAAEFLGRISRPLEQYLETPITAGGAGLAMGEAEPASPTTATSPGNPTAAAGGIVSPLLSSPSGASSWKERGIVQVELDQLPVIEGIEGPEDFKKVPKDKMMRGILRLQEMSPVLRTGQGQDSDYWREHDAARGLSYEDGYQVVYDSFYGSDPIRVEHDGDSWDIASGRHRILVARELGMTSLPISLVERAER